MIYEYYYSLSEVDLLNLLSKYVDVTTFWKDKSFPKHHQLATVVFFLESKHNGLLLLGPVGSGKSKIVLDICRVLNIKKCLYLCGTSVGIIEAEKQIGKHYPCKVSILPQTDGVFVLVSYGTLGRTNAYCVDNKNDTIKLNKYKVYNFVESLGFPEMLILDEAHMIVNDRTLIFSVIKELRKHIKYVIIITGTPVSTQILDNGVIDTRDIDIFALLHLWDPNRFKNRHAFTIQYGFKQIQTAYKFVWIADDRTVVDNLLKSIAAIIPKSDILPENAIPKQILTFIYPLTTEQLKLLNNTDFQKRRQIHSGFFYDKKNVIEINTNKTQLVVDLCNFLKSCNEKIVIIFEFTGSLQILKKCLNTANIDFVVVEADQSQLSRKDSFSAFDDKINVLLLSLKIGSMSANLQGKCRNMLFWDIPVNTRETTQAAGRIDRIIGQLFMVRFFFFISNREEYLLKRLLKGQHLVEGVING